MYPGCGMMGGSGRVYWEGYTRYPPGTLLGPIFNIYLRLGPTHGQMKAFFTKLMRFPKKGPERVQKCLRIDPELTPELTLQMTSRLVPR